MLHSLSCLGLWAPGPTLLASYEATERDGQVLGIEMIGKRKESERRREMQRVELMSWVSRWGRAALLNPFILCPELLHILFQTWAQIYHQGRAGMEDSLQKYKTEDAFVV